MLLEVIAMNFNKLILKMAQVIVYIIKVGFLGRKTPNLHNPYPRVTV